jgi:3-hydroxyacyl-[acyl-carrier-protein] dehydratase
MIDINEIKKILPQQYPFLMIDRVIELAEGKFIKAYKNISISEECFKGHFPDMPIFPGAFIAEAMAQAACILIKKSIPDIKATLFFITNSKIRFLKPVVPGDQLYVSIEAIKMTRIGGICEGEAFVDDVIVAKGGMTFACK